MGFMSYHIVGSDAASDFASNVASAVAKVCEKEVLVNHGKYNSAGFVNVALVIEAMVATSPEVFIGHEGMKKVAIKVQKIMDPLLLKYRKQWEAWHAQQRKIEKGAKIPAKKLLKQPHVPESDLSRLGHISKVIRRYIEDCNHDD